MSIPQFLLKYCEQKNLKSADTTKFIFQIHYGSFKHAQSLTQMCSMMTAKLSNKWDMSKMSPRVEAEVSLTVSWLCGLVAKLGFLSRRTFLASTFRHDHNWWKKKNFKRASFSNNFETSVRILGWFFVWRNNSFV